jgi:Protein of unknown function (DUF1425)
MKPRWHRLLLSALGAALLAGCQGAPGSYVSLDSTKYTIENTDKFVQLDQTGAPTVSCTGLQERVLPDGRLEVVANVKNRENRRQELQINCVFRDEQGLSTGDETPFRSLILTENSTEAVKFTSLNNRARTYTIRVRQMR